MTLQHDFSLGTNMKLFKRLYFGTALLGAAFLLESLSPFQLF